MKARFFLLLRKLIGSRKMFFALLGQFTFWLLLILIILEALILNWIMLGFIVFFNTLPLIYLGYVEFEKVKIEVKKGGL